MLLKCSKLAYFRYFSFIFIFCVLWKCWANRVICWVIHVSKSSSFTPPPSWFFLYINCSILIPPPVELASCTIDTVMRWWHGRWWFSFGFWLLWWPCCCLMTPKFRFVTRASLREILNYNSSKTIDIYIWPYPFRWTHASPFFSFRCLLLVSLQETTHPPDNHSFLPPPPTTIKNTPTPPALFSVSELQ